jgi:predicted dinucleotide-binding enzyme
MTRIAFIGAGRVASTLARAFVANDVPVALIASRDDASAARLASRVDGAIAASLQDAAAADLVFLTVPDDDIAVVCEKLAWRADQAVVHCSGATEVAALAAAARSGRIEEAQAARVRAVVGAEPVAAFGVRPS